MWSPFRKKHLKILLELTDSEKGSLDLTTHRYFKENHSLGSKDRLALKKGLYEIVKWRSLLYQYKATTVAQEVELYISEKNPIGKDHPHLPSAIQVSFPPWLFQKIVDSLGYEKAMEFCRISNEEGPVTIRINTLKTTKEDFAKKCKESLALLPCTFAKNGFIVTKRVQFNSIEGYEEGHFEVQDEASQLIAEAVNAKPGDHILDFCAGSGGKSLAIASDMKGRGQLHLHDVRKKTLIDAKKRLKRAGIQNFQMYHNDKKRLKVLYGHMDKVLLDAPCSCSGTLRRRPDQKWGLTREFLEEITTTQKDIMMEGIPFVKKVESLFMQPAVC